MKRVAALFGLAVTASSTSIGEAAAMIRIDRSVLSVLEHFEKSPVFETELSTMAST